MSNADQDTVSILLDRITEVCPLPAAAQRVILLAGQEDVDIGDVAEAIAADPALAAEALRISNSAVFRRGRPVDTLGHAVLTLGLSQIHQMAAAMALMAAFRTEHELSLQFHESSVLSGSLAGLLASELGHVDSGVAFLAGLLSEVGAMACVAVDGQTYSSLYDEAGGDWERRATLEREHYTLTSWEIGERLLRRNDLPDNITLAVGAHYDMPLDELSHVARVTIFGRVAAPLIAALPGEAEFESIGEELGEIAGRCGVTDVSEQRLCELCHRGAAATARTVSQP